jgi:hypothetical protein
MPKRTIAIVVAPSAIPPKPNIAAMMARIRKINAHLNSEIDQRFPFIPILMPG